MARRGYPPKFRRRIVELVEGGRKVSGVAAEFDVSGQNESHGSQVEAGVLKSSVFAAPAVPCYETGPTVDRPPGR